MAALMSGTNVIILASEPTGTIWRLVMASITLISPIQKQCATSPDIINFGAAAQDILYGASSSDTISFDVNIPETKNNSKYKYSEDEILKELQDYIVGTYNQHYSAGDDRIQTLDLIEACGDGEAFCRSNILKYASRYDKKGTARRDIMKILHYAVLLMHFNDKNAKRETYPQ